MSLENPSNIEIIVECTVDDEKEKLLNNIGKIKYRLPLINSYVLEIPCENIKEISDIDGVSALHKSARITAQMNSARRAVKAEKIQSQGIFGQGVTIAILDTGICPVDDFIKPRNRILAFKDFVNGKFQPYDDNGHGTHVAGIAAGNGTSSRGKYAGIAPESRIISIKVLDSAGAGNSSDVLAGLQWILDKKDIYNIRVANLSVGTSEFSPDDPLIKGVEAAWSKGIVIIIAAGNNGPGTCSVTSPGVSRKVITVGASDDHKKVQIWGDTLENYSGRGPTLECIIKPDIIAPGGDIISCLTKTLPPEKAKKTASKIVNECYIKMSGTSMSTPMVAGAIALLLQKHPELTPDDVKYMVKTTADKLSYPKNQQGSGLLNVENLLSQEAKYVR